MTKFPLVRSICLIFLLLSVLLPVGADPVSPGLSQVEIIPASADTPPSFTGIVIGGPPGGTAWLQVSFDIGVTDPWMNIATTGLDNLGSATFTNVADPRVLAAAAQRNFFRVVTSAVPYTPPTPEGFALIPEGSFTMGRTSGDDDSNAYPVTVNVSTFYGEV